MIEQEMREIQNETEIRKTDPAWAIVCEFMYHSGIYDRMLSHHDQYAIYQCGDGFGRLSAQALRKINGGWDWSHVRDSSREGVLRMEKVIQTVLARKQMKAVYVMPNERENHGGARVILRNTI